MLYTVQICNHETDVCPYVIIDYLMSKVRMEYIALKYWEYIINLVSNEMSSTNFKKTV